MIDILTAAGYRTSSTTGRMSSSHPLFHRVGPDRYKIITDPSSAPVTSYFNRAAPPH